ncbi:carbohydrate ABC transporter permease [Cohnella sp. REN36]|uniref:carbohydrate ABC transporter permease n=1 Tax=Cohnella sp. REN36 TaxID=2887347 RepID=UPI001D149131|nr:carbohydrate ABC transporter permease [Cohnella sp. REN36]MCC3376314.1 carbohydrate ABC transporter permease [Cohnella sp. REN36]
MSTAKLLHRSAIYLILVAGSIAMIFPFAWLVRSSFMSTAQIFTFPPEWIPRPFEWQNYRDALTVVPFRRYFLNTMLLEVCVVSGVVLTSAMAGYSFARLRWPGRGVMFGLLLSTLMLPYAVTLIPTFMLWKSVGAINTYWPLIVPAWFGGGAFNIFLLRQFFSTIPKDLDEAAYMDGASPPTVLWKLILPLSKPAIIVILIFTFIGTWNDFLGPLIYLSDNDKYTLALGLASFRGMYNAQWGYLMAASSAIVAPIILLFFVAQRYFIGGITLTGIKG